LVGVAIRHMAEVQIASVEKSSAAYRQILELTKDLKRRNQK
jgi:hypothetical protein